MKYILPVNVVKRLFEINIVIILWGASVVIYYVKVLWQFNNEEPFLNRVIHGAKIKCITDGYFSQYDKHDQRVIWATQGLFSWTEMGLEETQSIKLLIISLFNELLYPPYFLAFCLSSSKQPFGRRSIIIKRLKCNLWYGKPKRRMTNCIHLVYFLQSYRWVQLL